MSSMPSANAGNEIPVTANVMLNLSGQRLRHTAAMIPAVIPNNTAHAILAIVSHSDGIKRLAISSETGRRETIDVPKSPCNTLVM